MNAPVPLNNNPQPSTPQAGHPVPVRILAATALAVSSVLGGAASAHASGCANWTYFGPLTLKHSDGVEIRIPAWNGTSPPAGEDAATLYLADGTPAQIDAHGKPVGHGSSSRITADYHSDQTGSVTGGIRGSVVTLDVNWAMTTPHISNHLTGNVLDDGKATGVDTNNSGTTTAWEATQPFTCVR